MIGKEKGKEREREREFPASQVCFRARALTANSIYYQRLINVEAREGRAQREGTSAPYENH